MTEYYKKPYTLQEVLFRDQSIQLSCNNCGKKTDDLYLVTKRNRDYLMCEYHANKRRDHDNRKDQEL